MQIYKTVLSKDKVKYLLSDPEALGSIPGIPKKISEEIKMLMHLRLIKCAA